VVFNIALYDVGRAFSSKVVLQLEGKIRHLLPNQQCCKQLQDGVAILLGIKVACCASDKGTLSPVRSRLREAKIRDLRNITRPK
jgi:hypothetical protein